MVLWYHLYELLVLHYLCECAQGYSWMSSASLCFSYTLHSCMQAHTLSLLHLALLVSQLPQQACVLMWPACLQISARCMLSIFQFFATKTDASVLRMLNGSPDERLLKPIAEYITSKGGRIHTRLGCKEVLYQDGPDGETRVTGLRLARAGKEQIVKADAYIAALDVPGKSLVRVVGVVIQSELTCARVLSLIWVSHITCVKS